MEQQTLRKLQGMINRPFKYGIRVVTITGYDVDEAKGRVYIHTNEQQQHWDRPIDAVRDFLKEFQQAEAPVKKDSMGTVAVNNTSNVVESLRMVLMENIEKVREDAGYIAQATAINNNVNSIINLSKLQLDAVRMQRQLLKDGEQ